VELTRDLFSAVPTTIDQLAEDARLVESLTLHGNIKDLQDAIGELESDPDQLIAALEKDGFGPTSREPAKRLWVIFLQVAKATNSTPSAELPWRLVRDFAIRLSNKPEAAAGVAHLITGLIELGERLSAPQAILKVLGDNLRFMKSFMGTEPTVESTDARQASSQKRSFASKFFGRRPSENNPYGFPRTSRRSGRMALAGLALFATAALCGSAFYLGFDQVRIYWSKISFGATAQQPTPPLGAELVPPVGTGQHLDLEGVRYCHFQQERLGFIKQAVQRPEDARAYNLLIIDYNSRCSDFFYQDNDLKLVLAEVSAKKNLLEAEAKQIMSTWPRHPSDAHQ
jgi:hypothetical protein